jgi:hypothetical protein
MVSAFSAHSSLRASPLAPITALASAIASPCARRSPAASARLRASAYFSSAPSKSPRARATSKRDRKPGQQARQRLDALVPQEAPASALEVPESGILVARGQEMLQRVSRGLVGQPLAHLGVQGLDLGGRKLVLCPLAQEVAKDGMELIRGAALGRGDQAHEQVPLPERDQELARILDAEDLLA